MRICVDKHSDYTDPTYDFYEASGYVVDIDPELYARYERIMQEYDELQMELENLYQGAGK